MRRVLDECPGLTLPGNGASPISLTVGRPGPASTHGGATVYANCTAAREAGVTPIRRGTPLYAANRSLDRDGDGIACE